MTDNRISPIKALNFIRENALKYAQARANVIYMQEYRKSLKALLMSSCEAETLGAKEIYAYAHPEYIEHLENLKNTIMEFEQIRWLMVGAEAKIEVWRSLESSARLENRYSSIPDGDNNE
jgi:hypothetical protein